MLTSVFGEMTEVSVLETVLRTVESGTKKLENFLSVQNDVASKFQKSTKQLYDFTKNSSKHKTAALPELVIDDFDEEQIWQQLEIQNEAELTHLLTSVSRVLAAKSKLALPVSLSKPTEVPTEDDADEKVEDEEREDEELELGDSDSDEMDLDIDVDGNLNKSAPKRRPKKPSIVDDKFFKLEELDEYLTKEEKKEEKPDAESEASDDESVDLFNDDSDVDEDDDDDEAKIMKYADFFDSPESAEENEPTANDVPQSSLHSEDHEELEEPEEPKKRKLVEDKPAEKKVKFNLTNDSDDSDSVDTQKTNEQIESAKSTLESRQERLEKRIRELENEAVSEKPWQLKGEVTASCRPQNSLLEEFVEFDVTSRPAPIITEQTTVTLEGLIKQRIKDKAWDDVEKKFKPVETPLEYKKKLVMDQEKSQKSLAQIYEDAYLKQKDALNPDSEEKEEEEPQQHKEIREMTHSLFTKLDALSNFHYTPRVAQPEIKIISNVPAINMEEVAPVATSDAALLAPEEVKDKGRGEVIGKSERSKTDLKRARRKKKAAQHEKQKAAEKKEKTLGDLVEMKRKKFAKKKERKTQDAMLKKLTKDRNISRINETSKAPKSSTAFFTQLQDEVSSHIKAKTKPAKKKDKVSHSAIKLKL